MNDKKSVLKILVVSGQPFQRRLLGEILRAAGRVDIGYAETAEQCVLALSYYQPDLLITDWALDGADGLTLTKRVRAGEAGEGFKAMPIVLISDRTRSIDVERARNAGVDEFVVRPFSTATMLRRVAEVRARKREFIESTRYVGPCRRRGARDADYDGPKRRLFDAADKQADSPDTQIRKGLVRMYCESLGAMLRTMQPGDVNAMRDLSLSCGQLATLAGDMNDRLLMSATSSLFNYVKGIGAEAPLNPDVVQAHLDAVLKLAELPNFEIEVRQTVTQQLSVMVTKKLRQAGQAA